MPCPDGVPQGYDTLCYFTRDYTFYGPSMQLEVAIYTFLFYSH